MPSRPPIVRASYALPGELVVDNFAGGGGASTGLERAIGRPVDIAINHDSKAIALHKANHPETKHYCENIWKVDPREACAGRPVGIAWFSPDCTHFSRAKGTAPVKKEIRGLAWVVVRWAKTVAPRVIVLENVEEFETWGPLLGDRPDPARKGETFRKWLAKLTDLGYSIEFRSLVAADYGAPTLRKRLYLIARRDGGALTWPGASHGLGRPEAWKPAHEIIDWDLPCPSIFERRRPLAEGTLRRIAKGIHRYVIGTRQPFIVRHGHYSKRTGAGLREGCGAGTFRGQSLEDPLATICATNDKNLVLPHLTKHYGGMVGHEVDRPIGTITGKDHHALTAALLRQANVPAQERRPAEVRAFLTKYYGTGGGQPLLEPLHTVTSKDTFGLVQVAGQSYQIADIGMRMLQPRELFDAQGFPADYLIDLEVKGRRLSKADQTRMAGNSVCPDVAEAIAAEVLRQEGRRAA